MRRYIPHTCITVGALTVFVTLDDGLGACGLSIDIHGKNKKKSQEFFRHPNTKISLDSNHDFERDIDSHFAEF